MGMISAWICIESVIHMDNARYLREAGRSLLSVVTRSGRSSTLAFDRLKIASFSLGVYMSHHSSNGKVA